WCWWWSSLSKPCFLTGSTAVVPALVRREEENFRPMQPRSSAWTLAAIYAALIVFASLFPFEGWRVQGVDPWVFLTAQLPPPYWTWFDVNTNIAGYVPLGVLLALGMLRDGRRARWAVPLAALLGA